MTAVGRRFSISLRHLSNDGKFAAANLAPAVLPDVAPEQLHALLRAASAIAGMVKYPVEPEIRIAGPAGNFVVRLMDGELHLVSWSSAHKGGPATPSAVMAAVLGDTPEVLPETRRKTAGQRQSGDKRSLVALGLAIVLVNCFTVWVLTRPTRTMAAKARLLAPEPAERVLAEVAGAYETGRSAGDRRLLIRRDGSVQRVKLGPDGSLKDQQAFTVQPADAEGKRVLVTSRKSLVTVRDSLSLVLYGDVYTRVLN